MAAEIERDEAVEQLIDYQSRTDELTRKLDLAEARIDTIDEELANEKELVHAYMQELQQCRSDKRIFYNGLVDIHNNIESQADPVTYVRE